MLAFKVSPIFRGFKNKTVSLISTAWFSNQVDLNWKCLFGFRTKEGQEEEEEEEEEEII